MTMTDMSASFETNLELDFPHTTVQICAQLYSAPASTNIYSPIDAAKLFLSPEIGGETTPAGKIAFGVLIICPSLLQPVQNTYGIQSHSSGSRPG